MKKRYYYKGGTYIFDDANAPKSAVPIHCGVTDGREDKNTTEPCGDSGDVDERPDSRGSEESSGEGGE